MRIPERRWVGLGIGAMAVLLLGVWLAGVAGRTPSGSGGTLDDLLMDLQIIPLDGQTPKPFSLPGLDGRQVALADVAGKAALLYFWATW